MSEGVGGKHLTARNLPDVLGDKIGMKWAPVRALKLPTISNCIVFQGEAIGNDGKAPKPLFWVETQSFRVEVFDGFLVDFWVPLTNEQPPFVSVPPPRSRPGGS